MQKIIFSWIYDYAISGKIIKYVDVYNNFFNAFTIIIYISVTYFSCYKTVKDLNIRTLLEGHCRYIYYVYQLISK